ncbi:MAG TPA: hypothetical protein VHY22_00495 [Chthoniobacteraceae bacterium]|jgi:hypothetical protein|nr:hypothetical protein [Chthoniobacteraceae bacterium]
MRKFLRRLMGLAALLILGFLAWGGWYVCNHGFSRHWRLRVSQEFRRRGLDLYVHRLTLDPIQGLVAREVEVHDAADPTRLMATVDRVALDINLTNLLHDKPFLDAVDLRNANLSLPLNADDPQSERIKVSHLNARVIFPPHEWYVSQAEALMYGIQVSARGRLQNPEAFHPGESAAQSPGVASRPQMALDFLKELGTLHYGGAPPRLEINFGGDLADMGTLYADATLWGAKIRRNGAELTQLYAALGLRGSLISLKQCNISDVHGEMDASGSFDMDKENALLELRSTLDPRNLARLLKIPDPLENWRFNDPPELELSGSGTLGQKPAGLVTGRLALQKFSIKDTGFTGAGADFSWNGDRWYVRNGWLRNASGTVTAQAMSLPGNFRARVNSGINPNSLRGLATGGAADALKDWDFQETPRATLSITGSGLNPAGWETQGWVGLGRTRMRGVPLDWASAGVEVKGPLFTYENFDVQRDEGAATGTFSYDFGKHEAWLTNIHAHLNTSEAAVWIDPDLALQLAPYRFKTAPNLVLDGFVQCANDKGTHLTVQVDAPGGMDYTFCKRVLDFSRIKGQVLFGDHRIDLKDVDGALAGGSIKGDADIPFGRNAPGYTANVNVSEVDFASMTKLYFDYSESRGLLNGYFNFGGKSDDPWQLYGSGMVQVTEGDVFAIPVFGPFSGILNTLVPGMGYNLAHDGTCTFAVKDGVISTRDFVVKGRGFSMIGDGSLYFLDDRLKFNIRLNAQGLPGVLLFPVSKLLEYTGAGTLEQPQWKPVLLQGRHPPAAASAALQAPAPPRLR